MRARVRFGAPAHAVAAAWVLLLVGLRAATPDLYDRLLQEDRFIEWWTVPLFAGAGFVALRRAIRERRAFDVLVGLFCIFVAGEEFSWGQRLFGITPPDTFIEHNRQQELTLHNFADVFGQPKWVLIMALTGFGVLLPLMSRVERGRELLATAGATVPRAESVGWFVVAIVLLVWYPLPFTGEWVETLAGGLFLLSFAPDARTAVVTAVTGAVLALGLTLWSGRGLPATPAQLACARGEAQALVDDIVYGAAATPQLGSALSVHKRIHTAGQEGLIDVGGLSGFRAVSCVDGGEDDAGRRRAHVVDPWGMAYWLELERRADSVAVRVYSFGPNRRRDVQPDGGDDLEAMRFFTVPAARGSAP